MVRLIGSPASLILFQSDYVYVSGTYPLPLSSEEKTSHADHHSPSESKGASSRPDRKRETIARLEGLGGLARARYTNIGQPRDVAPARQLGTIISGR